MAQDASDARPARTCWIRLGAAGVIVVYDHLIFQNATDGTPAALTKQQGVVFVSGDVVAAQSGFDSKLGVPASVGPVVRLLAFSDPLTIGVSPRLVRSVSAGFAAGLGLASVEVIFRQRLRLSAASARFGGDFAGFGHSPATHVLMEGGQSGSASAHHRIAPRM